MYHKQYYTGYGSTSGSCQSRRGRGKGMWWEGLQRGFSRRPKYNVPLNIVDTDTAYEVQVYALSFDKDHIKVSVEDDVLYIRGTRTVDKDNLPRFRRQEYPIKSFERNVALNDEVDIAQIAARQENGVLIVTLPKKPEVQSQGQEINID